MTTTTLSPLQKTLSLPNEKTATTSTQPPNLGPLQDGQSIQVQTQHPGLNNQQYTITRCGNLYSCTCPAWLFAHHKDDQRRGWKKTNFGQGRRTCKHILELRGAEAERERLAMQPNEPASVLSFCEKLKPEIAQSATHRFAKMRVADLKELLRYNEQLVTGAKEELVHRCVDRFLHGNMPRCPECGGGRMQYGWKGKYAPFCSSFLDVDLYSHQILSCVGYFCPGFWNAEEDRFTTCFYTVEKIERPPWTEPHDLQRAVRQLVLPSVRLLKRKRRF